jgi:hypothetical protein
MLGENLSPTWFRPYRLLILMPNAEKDIVGVTPLSLFCKSRPSKWNVFQTIGEAFDLVFSFLYLVNGQTMLKALVHI